MDFEPWTEEPTGPLYPYMARASGPAGVGYGGFIWPEYGYVSCHEWEGEIGKAPEFNNRGHGGLWGFFNGEGWWELPMLMTLGHTFQIVKVSLLEVSVELDNTIRSPHGWVKYNGSLDYILQELRSEGSLYADVVAYNIYRGVHYALRCIAEKEPYQSNPDAGYRDFCAAIGIDPHGA